MRLLLLIAFLTPLVGVSQKIENLRAMPEGDKVIITFDIVYGHPDDKYDIVLYSSSNNFKTPLLQVSGDVGKGLAGGKNRRIEWNAKTELGKFKGDLIFEVQVEVLAAFTLKNEIKSVKRGKSIQVEWRGGAKDRQVKIELLKAGVSEALLDDGPNDGTFYWAVPSNEKTGSDYQLRLVNGENRITTQPFPINHKVPTLVKALPVAAIVAIALAGGGSSSSSNRNLASPPDMGLD